MDNLIMLLREWHPIMQLIFMMILTIFVMFIGIAIFFEIAKFFNQTLPIILRGWPSNHKEGDDKDEE